MCSARRRRPSNLHGRDGHTWLRSAPAAGPAVALSSGVTRATYELVREASQFLAAPIGRCILGPNYLVWCDAPDLVGSIQWGALNDRDVRELVALFNCVRHPAMAATVCVLWDCRDVERVDSEVLLELVRLLRIQLPSLSPRIHRQAVVVPDGLPGVLLAGALPSLAPRHPVRPFRELEAGYAFIGHPGAAAAHEAAAAMAIQGRGSSVLVARVRAHLASDLDGATVATSAAALGLSTRTLQRELSRCETSFSDELRRMRVAAAEELLKLSDMKIEAIASRVGYGTASRLTATLLRERQATASELRSGMRRFAS